MHDPPASTSTPLLSSVAATRPVALNDGADGEGPNPLIDGVLGVLVVAGVRLT